MYKIAVLGGSDTVLGFKALGLDTFPIADDAEARAVFHRATSPEENYAIIYLEERLSLVLKSEIAKFNTSVTPAIILIPGRDGSMGLSLTALHESAKRAIGADIL